MAPGTRGEVFADYDASHPVWIRNSPSAGEMRPEWHIAGPRMPRIAPVSPTSVSPCGFIIHADASETTRDMTGKRNACGFCTRWLEALGWEDR